MKRLSNLRLTAAAALAAALLTTAALADGLFSGFPLVGGGSYCGSYVNGVCTSTIPPGPAPSGTERIPADTGFSGGRSPQTVLFPSVALGGGAIQTVVPLTGATVTVNAAGVGTPAATTTTGMLVVNPAGTLSTLTIVLPPASALVDRQKLVISPTQVVTTLTLTPGSGTTFATTAPTSLAVGTPIVYTYSAADAKWYRG